MGREPWVPNVTYRTYAIQGQTGDAFWIVKSTDGGRTFAAPRRACWRN